MPAEREISLRNLRWLTKYFTDQHLSVDRVSGDPVFACSKVFYKKFNNAALHWANTLFPELHSSKMKIHHKNLFEAKVIYAFFCI